MKVLLLLGLACALSQAYATDLWIDFKAEYGKVYSAEEDSYRKSLFYSTIKKVNAHNDKYLSGQSAYFLRLNRLADMTLDEVKSIYYGYKPEMHVPGVQYVKSNTVNPETVDWRSKGAVTPVKNQGSCGSCWAFSTTGSLEGQHFLKTGQLVSLSEQQLVDCSESTGNLGCNGGLVDNAFKYIMANNGLDTEASYPYTGEDDACKFKKSNVGATLKSYVDIPSGDESALKDAAATVGPISVAIDASHDSFTYYGGGVYSEPDCSSQNLDHAVLVVGYGTENGQDYWLVKNSWGREWGDEGYIKMSRNANNQCGIATQSSYPVV